MAKMGRPTVYDDGVLEKTKQYLVDYKELGDVIPSVEGLAIQIGVRRETLYDWAKQEEKKDFSNTLDELRGLQQKILIENGLEGKFNSTITKLMLGTHGITEKTNTDITSGGKRIKNEWTVNPVTTVKSG